MIKVNDNTEFENIVVLRYLKSVKYISLSRNGTAYENSRPIYECKCKKCGAIFEMPNCGNNFYNCLGCKDCSDAYRKERDRNYHKNYKKGNVESIQSRESFEFPELGERISVNALLNKKDEKNLRERVRKELKKEREQGITENCTERHAFETNLWTLTIK